MTKTKKDPPKQSPETKSGHNDGGAQGMSAIINSVRVTHERLPMMEIIVDRLIRASSTILRNFTADSAEVMLKEFSSVRFGEYLRTIKLPAIMFGIKIKEWDNYGLISLDAQLIHTIIDVLMGGKHADTSIDERSYTSIETALVKRVVDQIAEALTQAFKPLAKITFITDKLETNPRFVTITRPANAAILIRIHITIDGRGGILEITLPYATLEPVREELLQMFAGEKLGNDPIWEDHLTSQLCESEIMLSALLFELDVPLKTITQLKVGDTIASTVSANDQINLLCGDKLFSKGHIGKVGDNISVRLAEGLRPSSIKFDQLQQKGS